MHLQGLMGSFCLEDVFTSLRFEPHSFSFGEILFKIKFSPQKIALVMKHKLFPRHTVHERGFMGSFLFSNRSFPPFVASFPFYWNIWQQLPESP